MKFVNEKFKKTHKHIFWELKFNEDSVVTERNLRPLTAVNNASDVSMGMFISQESWIFLISQGFVCEKT